MQLRLIIYNDSLVDNSVDSVIRGTKIDASGFIRSVRSTVERNISSTLELEQHTGSP